MSSSTLAGVLVLARHGDRQGFYQSPTTYTAKQTNLTVLGYLQEYKNGQDLRSKYIQPPASGNAIVGIDAQKAQDLQVRVIADAGGEGATIQDSANAMMQGLYPPYNETITLANGTVVSWGTRAQLIQVESVEADQEVWLEGYTDCNTWTERLNAWYDSSDFKSKSTEAQPFFDSLKPILGNRPAVLQNAWNIFDFLNVENIHNATLAPQIGAEKVAMARQWADYHEQGSFTDSNPSNVGNIAGQAMLPLLFSNLNALANASDPVKWVSIFGAYKPFLALGSLMQTPILQDSVVDYASTLAFAVMTNGDLQVSFRNGSEGDYTPLSLFGSSATSIPLSEFQAKLAPYAINTRADWCNKCGTTTTRGCEVLAALNGTGGAGYASDASTIGRHRVSPVTAGLIGAFVTLAIVAVLTAVLAGTRQLFIGNRRKGNAKWAVPQSNNSAGLELPSRNNPERQSIHTEISSIAGGKDS